MFEAHFDVLCDKIICVYTEKSSQLDRLMKRDNISASEALKKIESQMPIEEKIKKSDFILKSEEDFTDTKKNIMDILAKIREEYYAKTTRKRLNMQKKDFLKTRYYKTNILLIMEYVKKYFEENKIKIVSYDTTYNEISVEAELYNMTVRFVQVEPAEAAVDLFVDSYFFV